MCHFSNIPKDPPMSIPLLSMLNKMTRVPFMGNRMSSKVSAKQLLYDMSLRQHKSAMEVFTTSTYAQ